MGTSQPACLPGETGEERSPLSPPAFVSHELANVRSTNDSQDVILNVHVYMRHFIMKVHIDELSFGTVLVLDIITSYLATLVR